MPSAKAFLAEEPVMARPSAKAFLSAVGDEDQQEIAAGQRRTDQRTAAQVQRQADEELAMMAAGAFPSSLIHPETARTGLEILGTVGLGFLAPQAAIPAAAPRMATIGLRGANLLSRILSAGTGAGVSSLATEPIAPSPTGEAVPAALTKAGYAAAGQTGGEVLGPVLGKILAPVAKKVTPEGAAAIKTLAPAGARPTPSQATSSRVIDILENISAPSLIGGGRIVRAKEAASKAGKKLLLEYVSGQPVRGSQAITELYGEALERTAGQTVPMTTVKEAATEISAQATKLSPEVSRIARAVLSAADELPFHQAARLRSDLLGVSSKVLTALRPGAPKGAAKKLAGLLDEAMEGSARAAGPEASAAWRTANETHKRALAAGHMRDMIRKSLDAEGMPSGDALVKGINKMAPELKRLFAPDQLENFRKFATALQVGQSKSKEATGRMMIQLTQAGAMFGLATGTFPEGSAVILGGPAIAAYMLTNPVTARWLTTGFKAPGTPQATAAIARAIGLVSRDLSEAKEPKGEDNPIYGILGVSP